jgi:hypothetical protein
MAFQVGKQPQTFRFLFGILFFKNLLLGEQNELMSRYLVIGGWTDDTSTPTSNATTPTSKPVPKFTPFDTGGISCRHIALRMQIQYDIICEAKRRQAK